MRTNPVAIVDNRLRPSKKSERLWLLVDFEDRDAVDGQAVFGCA